MPNNNAPGWQRRQVHGQLRFQVAGLSSQFSLVPAQVAQQHFNSLQYHFKTCSYVNLCTLQRLAGVGTRWAGGGALPAAAKDEICVGLHKSTNWSAANKIFIFWELNYFLFSMFQSATVDFQLESIRAPTNWQEQRTRAPGPDVKECEGCSLVCPTVWLMRLSSTDCIHREFLAN